MNEVILLIGPETAFQPIPGSSRQDPTGAFLSEMHELGFQTAAGWLTDGRKIAAMADTYRWAFAPHDCIGPIGFIDGIHASFSQPNTLNQESLRAFHAGWYNELVTTIPVI